MVVGRGVATDIAIYDPTISRRHAELTARGDAVEVRDLGSSNGTCINGSRVTTGRLTVNDSVTFGKVTYRIQGRPSLPEPVSPEPSEPSDTIVRKLMVSAGGSAGITSRDGPLNRGQLRVAAATAEERQAKKLSMLLEVAQKLSGELELDRLLRAVVDMTFQVMEVDRVTILLRQEDTGELVPTISKSRLGDTQVQAVPRSIVDKVVEERVAVVSHNAPADTRFKGRSIVTQSVRSAMCSPLLASKDEVLGILYVDNLSARRHLQRRGPPVPRGLQRARRPRHQEQPLRRADSAGVPGPLQLRALLRAQRRGGDRAPGRRHPARRRAPADHRCSSATSAASPRSRSPWDPTRWPSS